METLKRILLVEDDPHDVELILTALTEQHLANAVVVVRDGVEALDYLDRKGTFGGRAGGNPVLILLDLKLPRLNGLDVLRCIKADEQMRLVPVVILTSSREDRDLAECYRLGVNAYVVKPVRFTEFMDTVKHIGAFWAMINEPPPGSRP
jgi:CheY-like chemotaxis protein